MSTPFWVKTLYPYTAESENELAFDEGVHLQVLDNSSEWWLGSLNDEQGYFPSNFVKIDPDWSPNSESTNENTQQLDQNEEKLEQEEQEEQQEGLEEETEEQKGQNMGGVSIGLNFGDILSARKNLAGSSTPKKTFVRPEKKEEPKVTNELFAMLNRRKQINKEKKHGQGQDEKKEEPQTTSSNNIGGGRGRGVPPRRGRSPRGGTGGRGTRPIRGRGGSGGRGSRPIRGRGGSGGRGSPPIRGRGGSGGRGTRPTRGRGTGGTGGRGTRPVRGRGTRPVRGRGIGRGGTPDIERGRGGIRKVQTVGDNVSEMNKTKNTVENDLLNLKKNSSVKDKFAMFNNPNKTSVRQTIAFTGTNTKSENSLGRGSTRGGRGIRARGGRGRGGRGRGGRGRMMRGGGGGGGRGGTNKPRPLTSAFSANKNLIAGLFQGPMNPLMKGGKPKPKKDPDIIEVKTETKDIQSENIKQENQKRELSVEKILENKIVENENEIILICTFDYEPQGEGEIKLTVGDKIKFSQFEGEGWSLGTIIGTDTSGYFPNEYVEEAPKETVIVQQKIEENTQRTTRLKTVRRARPGRKKRRPTSRRTERKTTQLKTTTNETKDEENEKPPKIPQLPNRTRRSSPLRNNTEKDEETTTTTTTTTKTQDSQEINKTSTPKRKIETPKRKIETPKKTEPIESNISNEIKKQIQPRRTVSPKRTTETKIETPKNTETKTKMEIPKKETKESKTTIPPRKTKTETKKETFTKKENKPKTEEKTIGKLRPITGNSDSVMVVISNGFISEIKNLPMGTSGIVFAPSEEAAKKRSQSNKKSLVLVINFQNGILGTLWNRSTQVPYQSKFN
ncbi:endophilin-a [Anaeramoeba flamelloides]|uniref:Endophilin-a n=1 Tax=Anaeramoeba flamelloides TaxID=1746091 RepID=A0AAV7ZZV2_9EUKA|nr:endophilin-a [Anaeramoeba flamelloides]